MTNGYRSSKTCVHYFKLVRLARSPRLFKGNIKMIKVHNAIGCQPCLHFIQVRIYHQVQGSAFYNPPFFPRTLPSLRNGLLASNTSIPVHWCWLCQYTSNLSLEDTIGVSPRKGSTEVS